MTQSFNSLTSFPGRSQLEKLQDKFSDMVVCPGVVSGAHADALDRLFIPGATSSFNKAREAMDRWKSKAETDERWNWWPGVMKEKGIKPITVSSQVC